MSGQMNSSDSYQNSKNKAKFAAKANQKTWETHKVKRIARHKKRMAKHAAKLASRAAAKPITARGENHE